MERFLYRLSKSPHGEKFVLKGALVLAMWEVSLTRPTKDIDLLGHVANDVESIVGVVTDPGPPPGASRTAQSGPLAVVNLSGRCAILS